MVVGQQQNLESGPGQGFRQSIRTVEGRIARVRAAPAQHGFKVADHQITFQKRAHGTELGSEVVCAVRADGRRKLVGVDHEIAYKHHAEAPLGRPGGKKCRGKQHGR